MKLSKEEFISRVNVLHEVNKAGSDKIKLSDIKLSDMKLDNMNLSKLDLSWGDFNNISFRNCNFNHSLLEHTKFRNTDFKGSSFKQASLFGADLRGCCLAETDCRGAVFSEALLSDADLRGLIHDENTVHFRHSCPQTGYFYAYKKCFNDRLVKLLIPKDAKRSSGTSGACRCDKAIVVAISDLDGKGFYKEAISFVDGNFVYKLGETVYADGFGEDRWLDSSHGIHFWMTEEEALGYM